MKRFAMFLKFALLCLLLAACAAFETGVQSEPVAGGSEALSTVVAPEQSPTKPATATLPATNPPEVVASETATPESVPAEVEPTETPTAPAASTAYAQGSAETLVLPGCYDFDHGASLAPPDPACDFNILPGPDSGTIEVYPVQTAQLAYGGVFPEPPTREQCTADAMNDAYSAEREIVAPMAAMYVCYRTAEGRTGYLHFTGADLQQAGTVTFDWLTVAGEEESSGTAAGLSDLVYSHDAFGFRLTVATFSAE